MRLCLKRAGLVTHAAAGCCALKKDLVDSAKGGINQIYQHKMDI
jgi:hypothetical protein